MASLRLNLFIFMQIKDGIVWLWRASETFRSRILCAGLIGMARVAVSLTSVWICKEIIDNVTRQGGGELAVLIPLMIGCMALRMVLSQISARLSRKTEARLANRLQHDLFDHLMRIRWDGHQAKHSGDILNRMIDDVTTVAEILCDGVPMTMVTASQLIGALYILTMMDVRLAMALLFMPAALLLSKSYVRRMRRLTRGIRSEESAVQSHIQESVQNRLLLRSLEYTPYSVSELDSLQSALLGKVMRYTDYSLFSRMMVQTGFAAGYVTAFLWGIFGIQSGAITFGTMTAFLQLVAQIQNPTVELSRQVPAFIRAMTSAERLAELFNEPSEPEENPVRLEGKTGIRIENLTFSYPEDEQRIFSDLSYDFTPGSQTAILGKTGIGKTTLMRLILALATPDSGRIVFYNEYGSEIPASQATRCNLSYVPQGNTLFSGTVRDNLKMGNPEATDEELVSALHAATADFVMETPEGLDSRCGEKGAGFSEGQAQRIAIARGLLRPGGVLLLDEPSSSLDVETERVLIERLKTKAEGKTLIVITHREEIAAICSSALRLG